jgi:hypothetical protein
MVTYIISSVCTSTTDPRNKTTFHFDKRKNDPKRLLQKTKNIQETIGKGFAVDHSWL